MHTISSRGLKALVNFSDRLSSVYLFVNNSHFHLPLQNHWTNFNLTYLHFIRNARLKSIRGIE